MNARLFIRVSAAKADRPKELPSMEDVRQCFAELAKQSNLQGTNGKRARNVREAAIQLAGAALRLAEEGDDTINLKLPSLTIPPHP